jgi:hypothetical protein
MTTSVLTGGFFLHVHAVRVSEHLLLDELKNTFTLTHQIECESWGVKENIEE